MSEAASETAGTVLCGAEGHLCRCREPSGHHSPHACPCGGSWRGGFESDDFEIISLPPLMPRFDLLRGGDW